MKGLSKSRHTALCQCPEALRLKVSKPKEAEVDEALQACFKQGKHSNYDPLELYERKVYIITSNN